MRDIYDNIKNIGKEKIVATGLVLTLLGIPTCNNYTTNNYECQNCYIEKCKENKTPSKQIKKPINKKKKIRKKSNFKKKNFVKKFKGYFEPYFCNDVIDKDGDGRVDFYRTGKEKELLGTKLVNGKLISKKYFNTNEKIMIGVRFKNSIGMKPRIKIWDKKNNLIRDSIFNSIVDKDESNRTWYNPNELKEGLYKVEFYIDNLFVGKDYFYVSE